MVRNSTVARPELMPGPHSQHKGPARGLALGVASHLLRVAVGESTAGPSRKAAQGEIAGLMKETVSGTAVVALRLPGARDRLGPTDNGRPAIRPRSRRAVLIIGGAAALNSPTDPGTPATNESNPEHLALAVVDELEHPGGEQEQHTTVIAAPRGDSDPGRQEHVGGPEAT